MKYSPREATLSCVSSSADRKSVLTLISAGVVCHHRWWLSGLLAALYRLHASWLYFTILGIVIITRCTAEVYGPRLRRLRPSEVQPSKEWCAAFQGMQWGLIENEEKSFRFWNAIFQIKCGLLLYGFKCDLSRCEVQQSWIINAAS